MNYLLDTSVVLAHHRGEAGWEAVQALIEGRENRLLLASASLTELARRLRHLGIPEDEVLPVVSGYRSLFDAIIAIDEEVAMLAFEIGEQTPDRLPLVDALIAAAAGVWDARLVHRDRHLSAIPKTLVRTIDLGADIA